MTGSRSAATRSGADRSDLRARRVRELVLRRAVGVAAPPGAAAAPEPRRSAEQARRTAVETAGRVEAALVDAASVLPADEVGAPREVRRALDVLARATERTVEQLDRDPARRLDTADMYVLEAVVRADGSRPTLLVRDGCADPQHPLAGGWAPVLAAARDRLRACCRAVGRIEPDGGGADDFFGTGAVVDTGTGLVLTNRHVVDAMRPRLGAAMEPTATGFRIRGGAVIDFAAEAGAAAPDRFRIVEATVPAVQASGEDIGFARLDAAVLRIEPTADGQYVPAAITAIADDDGPHGALASLCVVGIPARPLRTAGVHGGIDWSWVDATLFGSAYGVKRLAPGTVHRPVGTLPGDRLEWVFGHDATTLAGSSGSPVVSWLDPEPAAFGLHFAGTSLDTNCAHSVGAAADLLRGMGAPVR